MKENSGGNYMDADSTSGFNAFASGEAAMIVTGEFSLLNAQSINPDLQVGLFGVPLTENEEDAKLDVDVGICIAVNQNTPHLDAVREVLNYLSDNTDENGWMHYSADSMGAAHLQWILQCQQNISISMIIRTICQTTRQDHGYTHSLSPALVI